MGRRRRREGEVGQGGAAFVIWGVGPDGDGRDVGFVEDAGHESGVGDVDAEAEGAQQYGTRTDTVAG